MKFLGGKSNSRAGLVSAFADSSGDGGIRTPETLSSLPPFQGGALDHYATSPYSFVIAEKLFSITPLRREEL